MSNSRLPCSTFCKLLKLFAAPAFVTVVTVAADTQMRNAPADKQDSYALFILLSGIFAELNSGVEFVTNFVQQHRDVPFSRAQMLSLASFLGLAAVASVFFLDYFLDPTEAKAWDAIISGICAAAGTLSLNGGNRLVDHFAEKNKAAQDELTEMTGINTSPRFGLRRNDGDGDEV